MNFSEKSVAVMVGDQYQELEFWYPVLRLRELGAKVTVIGVDPDRIYRSRLGYPVQPDIGLADVASRKFDAIILPGSAGDVGARDAKTSEFLASASRGGAILAALSTGADAISAAGLKPGQGADGSHRTKSAGAAARPQKAGEPVTIDGKMITARSVDDLPAFFKALLAALEAAPAKSSDTA